MAEVKNGRALFRDTSASLLARIQTGEVGMKQTETDINDGKVSKEAGSVLLCKQSLSVTSCYLGINRLAMALVGAKHIDSINNARRTLYRALKALEIVIPKKLHLLSEDEAVPPPAAALSLTTPERYALVQKFALAIRLMINAYGDNQKLRWTFLDLEGHFAAMSVNILDMRSAIKAYHAMGEDYNVILKFFALQKKLLLQSALNYRTRATQGSGSGTETQDLNFGIQYMDMLVHFAMLTDDPDVTDYKDKLDLWESKRN